MCSFFSRFVWPRRWCNDLPRGVCVLVSSSVDHDSIQLEAGIRAVMLTSRVMIEPCGLGRSRLTHYCRADLRWATPMQYREPNKQTNKQTRERDFSDFLFLFMWMVNLLDSLLGNGCRITDIISAFSFLLPNSVSTNSLLPDKMNKKHRLSKLSRTCTHICIASAIYSRLFHLRYALECKMFKM